MNANERNVTFKEWWYKDCFFPCPVCHELLPVKISKKDKPYTTCEECGNQFFIRREKAEKLFAKLTSTFRTSKDNERIKALIEYYTKKINRLNKELKNGSSHK